MTLRPVVSGFAVAGVFWFLTFSPWTADAANFWLMMSLAATTLVVWSLVVDRKALGALYAFEAKCDLAASVRRGSTSKTSPRIP